MKKFRLRCAPIKLWKQDIVSVLTLYLLLQYPFFGSAMGLSEETQIKPDSLSTDSSVTTQPVVDTLLHPLDRTIENEAFHVGEKLNFVVRYGIIKAGQATMEVRDTLSFGDRTVYQIVSTAKSTGAFDWFFKVRDEVESWIDTQGIFSWKFHKKLREGGYKFDLLVDYYQQLGVADVNTIRYHDDEPLRVKDQENLEVAIPPYVLDILAAFYYVRTQRLRVGMPLYMSNHDNKKVYNLKVIIQKREIKEVDAGKFRCLKVQPQLHGEAIFKQEGKLWVWLTDDQYKIPVEMKSKVFVGSITTELQKIEGVPLPLPSQIK